MERAQTCYSYYLHGAYDVWINDGHINQYVFNILVFCM